MICETTKHGLRNCSEYRAWASMKQRCLNPKVVAYPQYGQRGIKVCDRWLTSFPNFYADMGPRPSPSHSLDRIDNDGDYTPDNCRWATRVEQGRNQRTNVLFTHNGKTQCLTAWSEEIGIPADTL